MTERLVKSAILFIVVASTVSTRALDRTSMRNWGLETANEIERTLRVPGTALYAETAALDGTRSGFYNRSFVWPAATQFRALDTLTQIDPTTYAPKLRQFSDQLYASYWNNGYRSAAGPSDRFYDDNGHIVVALVEAYRLTHDNTYLDRAKQTQTFVMSGADVSGGIRFQENTASGNSDAISTLQAARGAAMLYRSTGDQQYLNDATRLLSWSNSHIQYSDGLFYQRYNITTGPNDIPLINSAGIGILTNLELFDATATHAYLSEAERIATRTLTRYFDSSTGRINDQGYWAFELVDAFDSLYLHNGNTFWTEKIGNALTWLHNNKRDPNGHYGDTWGSGGVQTTTLSSWNLNEQASVARAYLYTSAVPEPHCAAVLSIAAALGLLRRRGGAV